jgi:hypothetical protein
LAKNEEFLQDLAGNQGVLYDLSMSNDDLSYMYRLWDVGQQHLAGGRYVAACIALEAAERAAWQARDARTLARVYLPLLEARRQIRYQAAEGEIVIGGRVERTFFDQPAGTALIAISSKAAAALAIADRVRHTMRRTGRWLEALLLIRHGEEVQLVSAADPAFAAGLSIIWTDDAQASIGASTDANLRVPLPRSGRYVKGTSHALARESLLIAWEALALKWQHRHPLAKSRTRGPWGELAWLRRALAVDPACEPVTMRLIALAEAIERSRSN